MGWSVIQAADVDAATRLLQDHPARQVRTGTYGVNMVRTRAWQCDGRMMKGHTRAGWWPHDEGSYPGRLVS